MDDLWARTAFKGFREGDPIVAQIRRRPQRVGRDGEYRDVLGRTNRIEYQKASAECRIQPQEAKGMSVEEFLKVPNDAGRDIARQMARHLFATLDKVTEATGNVIDAKGEPLRFEHFLAVLEKIPIEFDQHGRAQFPTAVLGPALYEQLQRRLPEWESDSAGQARIAEILSIKREEFREREARRRLVD